jgi:hypothetical protein
MGTACTVPDNGKGALTAQIRENRRPRVGAHVERLAAVRLRNPEPHVVDEDGHDIRRAFRPPIPRKRAIVNRYAFALA